jgi:hypothetical protein
MGKPGMMFKILLSASVLLVAAVLVNNAVDAYRLKDPDYARMLEDKKHYEEVISQKGLSMHPALHWKNIEGPGGTGGG